jgi:hypothetical protein
MNGEQTGQKRHSFAWAIIVIAVIGLLGIIAIPALYKWREEVNHQKCLDQLRIIDAAGEAEQRFALLVECLILFDEGKYDDLRSLLRRYGNQNSLSLNPSLLDKEPLEIRKTLIARLETQIIHGGYCGLRSGDQPSYLTGVLARLARHCEFAQECDSRVTPYVANILNMALEIEGKRQNPSDKASK